jgi:protein-disulfide isomerase
MKSEVKSVIIILIITAIIIVAGLSMTKGNGAATSVKINKDTLLSSTTPMIYGMALPAAQTVTIVEFGDFACPACAALSPNIDKLLTEYNGKVNYGFRIIPIHGDISIKSAVAVFAAGKQGKFFEMGSKLFATQDVWTKPGGNTTDLFTGYAKEVGVADLEMFKADIASETFNKVIKQMIDRDSEQGLQMGIRSTPTLIIAGTEVQEGVGTYAGLKKIVDAQLELAKNATGTPAVVAPPLYPNATSTVPAKQ